MKAVILPLVVLGLFAGARADDLRAEIVKQDDLVARAIRTHDMVTFKKLMSGKVTSDFKHVEFGKSDNFDQMVDHMKQGLAAMPNIVSVKATLLNLKITGDSATALTQHDITAATKGKDQKTHTMGVTGITLDAYRREGGKWKMASMTWRRMTQLIDGHKFSPKPMVGHMGPGG